MDIIIPVVLMILAAYPAGCGLGHIVLAIESWNSKRKKG